MRKQWQDQLGWFIIIMALLMINYAVYRVLLLIN